MKILKKISYVILIIMLLSSQVVIPDFAKDAEAKSLNDMKAELEELEKEYAKYEKQQESTQEEIAAAKEVIADLMKEKMNLEDEIEILNNEIKQLEADIVAKNEEMKNIVRYYQLSATGEDAYLEYLFTSVDFTDFIYRLAIAEQLSEYNDSLIDEYNKLITKNEEKKSQLSTKVVELDKKALELEEKLIELGDDLKDTMEGAQGVENEMKTIRRTIANNEKYYKEHGCDPNMEYEACVEKANTLPPGTGFYRPLKSGRITSNYGYREYWLNGDWRKEHHTGIDISAAHGSKVYAASEGQVKYIINAKYEYDHDPRKRNRCGGNMVFINHRVDGVNYTTGYLHLATIKVKEGDIVDANTVIGTVGGTYKEYWDNCSTGAHLHFQIGKGSWGNQYTSYSGFSSKSFNPRNAINFPRLGRTFSNRTTKY